ncbi:MAG: hypothetical protein WA962_07815, partial [Ornithinimicrobium sp.]
MEFRIEPHGRITTNTLVLAFLAAVTPVLGAPLIGVLIALFGLKQAADKARQVPGQFLDDSVLQQVGREIPNWAKSARIGATAIDIRCGLELAQNYCEAFPLTMKVMLEADFDSRILGDRSVKGAIEWFAPREPWSGEARYVVAERAIRAICTRAVSDLHEMEPVLIPLVQVLRQEQRARADGLQGTSMSEMASLTSLVY